MAWRIEDEKTHNEAVSPSFDGRSRDVSLLVLRGPDVGRLFVVVPPGGAIGRGADAEITLSDPTISRRAAQLELSAAGTLMISDTGSRNGIYVNGVRIARAELVDGNEVQLSNDTVLRVRYQHPAETALLDRLQVAASRDPVTDLPDRRYLLERLLQEISYARRRTEPLCMVLIDVDGYRKVVDADGQAGADRLMRELARRVRAIARREDVVARYGRDELAVVLRGTTVEEALVYAERVCDAIRARPVNVGDVPIRATATVGVAAYQRQPEAAPRAVSPDDVGGLIGHAEAAVYQGKTAGRDRVVRWGA